MVATWVNDNIGVVFSRSIKLAFHTLDGLTVASVQVRPGPEPAFVSGDEFYIRTGNQSRKLKAVDIVSYVQTHW